MKSGILVMLAGDGESTNIVYNRLSETHSVKIVIQEMPVPLWDFLMRRVRKLGFAKVTGQVMFQALIVPILRRRSKRRFAVIKSQYRLDTTAIPKGKIIRVLSLNSEQARAELRKLNPDLVVINGTRIISKETIGCVSGRCINMHAGITPLYRGVHGAYWALTEKKTNACGVTVHVVDAGIDTGPILGQARIIPRQEDNFCTYPLLQLGEGLPLLSKVVADLLVGGGVNPINPPQGRSKLWSHPTIFEYIWNRISVGAK